MAFYTSRVDDDGNEIERRQSARSLQSSHSSGSSKQNITSSRSLENNMKTSVRYVNQAAFIEKNSDQSDVDSSIDPMSDRKFFTNRSSHDSHASDAASSIDMISERKFFTHRISPADGRDGDAASSIDMASDRKFLTHRVSHDGRSDIVPPLDLQSEENYQPSARGYTFSYRKHCEAAKVKPDVAYQTWLSAKRKILSDEAARRKKVQEEKRHKEEERRQLADQKFQEWLAMKSRQSAAVARYSTEPVTTKSVAEQDQLASASKVPHLEMSEAEAKAKLDEWKRKKEAIEEERRAMKRTEEEMQRTFEEQRRMEAEEAWRKWVQDADKKPKPVPLNRGIMTLRGTVSDIYVNPNEWQGIVAAEQEN